MGNNNKTRRYNIKTYAPNEIKILYYFKGNDSYIPLRKINYVIHILIIHTL